MRDAVLILILGACIFVLLWEPPPQPKEKAAAPEKETEQRGGVVIQGPFGDDGSYRGAS